MFKPWPLFIGLRYVRSKRRNRFISFVSGFSLLGMTLGVAALIIVLSVMNGFDREIKQRLLHAVPHGVITQPDGLSDWRPLAERLGQAPSVIAARPFVAGEALASANGRVRGVQLTGLLPETHGGQSPLAQSMVVGELARLQPGEYGIVLGAVLARLLDVAPGDTLLLTLPEVSVTLAGVFPRSKRFRVVGLLEVGAQVDAAIGLIHLTDAQTLWRRGEQVDGLQLQLHDPFAVGRMTPQLIALLPSPQWQLTDWRASQPALFNAIQMEKRMVGLLLLIVVLVAAFNIVSSLVMMVADKRGDIAVLRTLGANGGQIQRVFMVQGLAVGLLGIALGALLGIVGALGISDWVHWLETRLGMYLFNPEIYFIAQLPSHLLWRDVLLTIVSAALLSVVATLYPAYRAGKIAPAEALRYQ